MEGTAKRLETTEAEVRERGSSLEGWDLEVTQLECSLGARLEALQKEETLLKECQEASAREEARLTRWHQELEEIATKQSFV